MKKVMVFGAFDGLHPGHIDFFRQAKEYGDYLVASVGTDDNVFKIKGERPLFNQAERVGVVKMVKIVDEVVLGAKSNFYNAIKKIKPDVICLGYDQWASEQEVKKGLAVVGLGKVKVVRLKPYKETRAKSIIVKTRSVDF